MRLLIGLSAALLLAIPTVVAALDCEGTLPLPDDVRLEPPGADVPARAARFAGAWTGAWSDTRGVAAPCTALVSRPSTPTGSRA